MHSFCTNRWLASGQYPLLPPPSPHTHITVCSQRTPICVDSARVVIDVSLFRGGVLLGSVAWLSVQVVGQPGLRERGRARAVPCPRRWWQRRAEAHRELYRRLAHPRKKKEKRVKKLKRVIKKVLGLLIMNFDWMQPMCAGGHRGGIGGRSLLARGGRPGTGGAAL